MVKSLRFGMVLSPMEKYALTRLAEAEGGLSQAATVRRLIRRAAVQRGFWPPPEADERYARDSVHQVERERTSAQLTAGPMGEEETMQFKEDIE